MVQVDVNGFVEGIGPLYSAVAELAHESKSSVLPGSLLEKDAELRLTQMID